MRTLVLMVFVFLSVACNAQHLQLRSYSAGYRIFEIEGVGNNPLTIAPFLKDPWAYKNYINSQVQYNAITGSPGPQVLRNYDLSTEWCKELTESRFWKKHTIQTGIYITNRLRKGNMTLENQRFVTSSTDTIMYRDVYSLVQEQQFLGLSVGLNRRALISNTLTFLTGFQFQGSLAVLHRYNQQWDSSVYHKKTWTTKTTELPQLQGKNYFQWQLLLPLALEVNAYKHELFFRAEFNLGFTVDRYRQSSTTRETDGVSFWVVYQPRH